MLKKSIITLVLATISCTSIANVSISTSGIHINGISIDGNGIKVTTGSGGVTSTSSQTSVISSQGNINTNGTISCTVKAPKAVVTGVNRNVQVIGNCQSISVNGTNLTVKANQSTTLTEIGTNNKIHINKVNSVTLNGTNATATYQSSFSGGEAMINVRGVNASVQRIR